MDAAIGTGRQQTDRSIASSSSSSRRRRNDSKMVCLLNSTRLDSGTKKKKKRNVSASHSDVLFTHGSRERRRRRRTRNFHEVNVESITTPLLYCLLCTTTIPSTAKAECHGPAHCVMHRENLFCYKNGQNGDRSSYCASCHFLLLLLFLFEFLPLKKRLKREHVLLCCAVQ